MILLASHGLVCAAAEEERRWQREILPLLENYCFDCHGDGLSKGDLALDRYREVGDMHADRDQWEKIRNYLEHHLMPPADEFQPKVDERQQILEWIDSAVFPVDPENPDPGRVTLQRLNRIEYENTLRDLLGVHVKVRDMLPPDDSGYGFDHIGDVLSISPAHLERYLEVANRVVEKVTHPDPMPFPVQRAAAKDLVGSGNAHGEEYAMITTGKATASFVVKQPGRYRSVIRAAGTRGGGEGPQMVAHYDGQKIHEEEVVIQRGESASYRHEIVVEEAGEIELTIAFTNDFYAPDDPDPNNRDRNLYLYGVELIGPLDGPRQPKPASHRRIFGERNGDDEAWALEVFERFGRRAFRRPLRAGEAERYLHFVRLAEKNGQSVEHGIAHGLEAMLVSPAFLFREEHPAETDPHARIQQIDEYALASRLSYFLWSTMPDERLMALAGRGELREQLDDEIERMLGHPKARQMVEHFVGQWLQVRDLGVVRPSRRAFPDFNPRLRRDMMRETYQFFRHLVDGDRPITDLLDADYTFVNARLAKHYGLNGVKGDDFQKVSLKGTPRRGLLGHGSFLLVTSHPLRTSPVLRGKYVLENLLGTTPPPPPPDIPQLTPPSKHGKGLSMREQLEKHRADPACASCHRLMDPIGFGLEHFAADGSWRKTDNGREIDASGTLVDGQSFAGVDELRAILVSDYRDDFLHAVASKWLTYALGRGTEWYDKPALDEIVAKTREADFSTRAMIHAIVHSVPFQYRRAEGYEP